MCFLSEIKKPLQTDSRAAICMAFEINPEWFDIIMADAPSRLEVIVTTMPTGDGLWMKKISACRRVFAFPFSLRFAIPEGHPHYGLIETEILRYPRRLVGNLLSTRAWIEEKINRVFLLSDDDPGTSYAGGEYEPRATQMIFTCGCNVSGGHRWTITPQVHYDVWRFGIALAQRRGSNYLGVNGSEATKGIFCNAEFFPIACNRSVNGITAVIKPLRKRIPKVNISQEFALMTAFANAKAGGTMTLMPLIRTYAVNAPKPGSVEQSQEIIQHICGPQFKAGNTGGGQDLKYNAIFHSTTVKTMAVEDLMGV
jgi:hypothetical protein